MHGRAFLRAFKSLTESVKPFAFGAAESQACTDAAADHLRGMEDQKAALLVEMEESAATAAASLEAERKASAESLAAHQQEHAAKIAELDAELLSLQVGISKSCKPLRRSALHICHVTECVRKVFCMTLVDHCLQQVLSLQNVLCHYLLGNHLVRNQMTSYSSMRARMPGVPRKLVVGEACPGLP